MRFVCMHGRMIPVGHWFERLVFVIKGGLGVYIHNVWHRVDGGPHGIGSNTSIFKVLHPLQKDKIPLLVWDSGVRHAAVVVGLKTIRARVHVIRYLKLLLDSVFKLVNVGGLLVSLCKTFKLSFSKDGHKATYNGSKHVSGKPSKAVSCDLG